MNCIDKTFSNIVHALQKGFLRLKQKRFKGAVSSKLPHNNS